MVWGFIILILKKILHFPRVGKGWRWNYEGGRVNEKKKDIFM